MPRSDTDGPHCSSTARPVPDLNPWGVITGFGVGAASTKDQPLAEMFFALRRSPHPGLASVGAPARSPYVVDKGFEGQANHRAWWTTYGAQVICPPKRNSKTPWPKPLRRWLAGVRQIVETVHDKLQHTFRLDRERPHALRGLRQPKQPQPSWRPARRCKRGGWPV